MFSMQYPHSFSATGRNSASRHRPRIPKLLRQALALTIGGWLVSGNAWALDPACTNSALNLRFGPGTGYSIIATIPPDHPVDVVGCTPGEDWCEVDFRDTTGWVSNSYLRRVEPPGAPPRSDDGNYTQASYVIDCSLSRPPRVITAPEVPPSVSAPPPPYNRAPPPYVVEQAPPPYVVEQAPPPYVVEQVPTVVVPRVTIYPPIVGPVPRYGRPRYYDSRRYWDDYGPRYRDHDRRRGSAKKSDKSKKKKQSSKKNKSSSKKKASAKKKSSRKQLTAKQEQLLLQRQRRMEQLEGRTHPHPLIRPRP